VNGADYTSSRGRTLYADTITTNAAGAVTVNNNGQRSVLQTGSNNVKGQVVTFNRNGCVVGNRRTVQVETERLPATDQTRIVYSLRAGFGRFTPTGAASGIEWADVMYNVSL
jgi:hypothetical protein